MQCPNLIRKRFGDESQDFCKLADMKVCLLVGGYVCAEWEKIQKEWWAENDPYAEVLAEDYGSGGNSEV